jgi:hypothetical protein
LVLVVCPQRPAWSPSPIRVSFKLVEYVLAIIYP